MTQIHKESDFKLQIYFPNIEKNTLKAFTFRYYTNEGRYWCVSFDGANYHNCIPCPGGVLANFKHGNSECPEFNLGVLCVKTEFIIPDASNPGHTITISDHTQTELEIVSKDATFIYNPMQVNIIETPSYNKKSPYPVHALIFPQGDKGDKGEKGDKGKDAITYNPACLTETKCEGEFILEPDGVTESQLYQKSVVVRINQSYQTGARLNIALFGWGYKRIYSINGYSFSLVGYAFGENLPIGWWGNIEGSIIPQINRNVTAGETWITTIKYTKNN